MKRFTYDTILSLNMLNYILYIIDRHWPFPIWTAIIGIICFISWCGLIFLTLKFFQPHEHTVKHEWLILVWNWLFILVITLFIGMRMIPNG